MPNLTEYQGNAGLGIGSGGGPAPLGPNDNLKIINDTGRDIMLLDSERNMKLFQQKVADRDHVSELILKNQVSAGEIDPKYRKFFDDARDASISAFTEWGGDVNNTKSYQKYQDAITHLQDVATHAQTNTIEMKKLIQQKSQETLPWKQKALDDHIQKQQSKDFWDHIDPYQQMFSFSVDPINKLYKTSTTTVTSPDNLWKYDLTHGDYSATLKNAQNEYLNHGEASEDMRQWLTQVENYDPPQKKKFVDAINAQLQKYNAALGASPGTPMYADPIQLVKGPDGKDHIQASPVDFSAKYSLAQQEKYVVQGPGQFQKDYGAYQAKLSDTAIKKAKLGVDWYNAKTRRGALSLKQRQLKNMTEDEKQFSQTYDRIGESINLPDLSSYKLMGGGDSPFTINLSDIPEGATYMQGIGPNGQPIQLLPKGVDLSKGSKDPGVLKDKSGNVLGYKGGKGHYDTNFFVPAGTVIGGKSVSKDISLSPKELYKLYENSGSSADFKDFIQEKFKSGQIDYQIEGANGKADRVSSYVSQRAMGNKLTKKGQVSPYGSDELDLIMSSADSNEPDDQTQEP